MPRNFPVCEQFSRPRRPNVECGAFLTRCRDEHKFCVLHMCWCPPEMSISLSPVSANVDSDLDIFRHIHGPAPPWSIDSRVCYGVRQHGFGNSVAICALRKGFRNKRNMFKISTIDTRSQRTLIVEGTLIGSWVAELRTTWRTASQELNGRKLVIDLGNLTVISIEGEDTILDLMKEGAKFSRGGILTRHVLKQLTRKKEQELPRR